MLTGPKWTNEDIINYKVNFIIASRGELVDITPKNELTVETFFGIRELNLSESVFWYASMFDALDYDVLYERYYRAEKRLGVKLEKCQDVVKRLLEKDCLCAGVEPNREDALFSLFSTGAICKVLDDEALRCNEENGIILNGKRMAWPLVEQTPRKTLPISDEAQMFLDMLEAENWCIAEITRNFIKGYDVDITRDEITNENFKILSLRPNANVVRMNYEKNPMARTVALIALGLLRRHKIILI